MSVLDHHLNREDQTQKWCRIATAIENDPQLLEVALANISRWEDWGRTHPWPLQEWRRLISAALDSSEALCDLITYLRTPNHDAEPLKSCSPFVGAPAFAPQPS